MPVSITETDHADLPPIPDRRYFSIGEASQLCGVKTHVLRYWEQEFSQLHPVKRRGNRRYYQANDIIIARNIRELLYHQGFTIQGARQQLDSQGQPLTPDKSPDESLLESLGEIRQELESIMEMLEN